MDKGWIVIIVIALFLGLIDLTIRIIEADIKNLEQKEDLDEK